MADHPALTARDIEVIRARIGTETARQLAAEFGLHETTIRRHTRGMRRATRRDGYRRIGAPMLSDEALEKSWWAGCLTIETGLTPTT